VKKRLLISIILAAIMLLVPASAVLAANPVPITITATPGKVSIAVTPATTWAIDVIDENTTKYSGTWDGTGTLADETAYFTVTNDGTGSVDITITGADFTGGVGWALTSDAPGENTVRLKAYKEGDLEAAGVILENGVPKAFISGLTTNTDFELRIETGTYTDTVAKEGSVTLTAAR